MEYKLETGVNIPKVIGRGSPLVYPWPDMNPGDSFLVEDANTRSNAMSSGKKYFSSRGVDAQFASRKTKDGKYRVWRVK